MDIAVIPVWPNRLGFEIHPLSAINPGVTSIGEDSRFICWGVNTLADFRVNLSSLGVSSFLYRIALEPMLFLVLIVIFHDPLAGLSVLPNPWPCHRTPPSKNVG